MWKFFHTINVVIFLYCAILNTTTTEEVERHPNDGWYNNLIHPDWGAIDTIMLRKSKASYRDGVYQPSGQNRPNPLDISRVAFSGSDDLGSKRNRSALLVFFGQQLVEEIVDAQRPGCPREYFNIKVPKEHKYNPDGKDDLEMPFLRARYDQRTGYSPNNPRQQLNEITPYLDGNLVYGAGKAWEDALRSFKDGRLLTADDEQVVQNSFPPVNDINLPFANPPLPRDHVLRPVSRFYRFGNPRTHENPFLVALAVVWFRYHNYLAGEFKKQNGTWNDEQIFNAARKRLIAQYQKIAMYEWLPAWLRISSTGQIMRFKEYYPYNGNGSFGYRGYDPNVHPGISMEFQAAAMRYGHTLVPSVVMPQIIRNNFCTLTKRDVPSQYTNSTNTTHDEEVEGLRLCNSFWAFKESIEENPGLNGLLLGMILTRAGREDNIIVSDLREHTFGPLEWSRRDLGALNIQRGRDLGLPGYNDVREAYGLDRKTSWEAVNIDWDPRQVLKKLKDLYNESRPDNLDLFAGGLLETTYDGPGELFEQIIVEQFLRIRHGDRFWYENYKQNKLFTDEEYKKIEETTFLDVLESVTGIPLGEKRNAFLCGTSDSVAECDCFDPVGTEQPVHETCAPLQHYDYFQGSEYSFAVIVFILILSVPVTILVMLKTAKKREEQLNASNCRPQTFMPATRDAFYATEWMGRSTYGHINSRDVKVTMDRQRRKILVSSISGQVVRMIDLRQRANWEKDRSTARMTDSCDKNYRLLKLSVPGEIDLVLHFPTQHERDVTHDHLKTFFNDINWVFHKEHSKTEADIWKETTTFDQRKEVLAKFFRKVLDELSMDRKKANTNQEPHLDDDLPTVTEDVLSTKLTRTEFADALGLQPQSLFVRNMFLLVDADGEGLVSFDEFKKYFGILCSGSAEQKAEMFFKMFNIGRNRSLSRDNFKQMVRSIFQLNENHVTRAETIDATVDEVFKKVGRDKEGFLTLADFKRVMFSDQSNAWSTAVLNLELNGQKMPNFKKQSSLAGRAMSIVRNYRKSYYLTSSMSVASDVTLKSQMEDVLEGKYNIALHQLTRYIDNHWRQIFWVSLYTFVTIGIFIERAYHFSFEREHAGLRRIAGYGVSITRGAASAMMFTFSSILVTMSRNTLTALRETFLHQIIPFDNAHDMHVYIAGLATFFTITHVIGHIFNLYHICTQPSTDLNCYFREYFRSSDTLGSFHYWALSTVTGLTGIFLTFCMVVIIVFAVPYSRRHVFTYFSITHKLYIPLYILMFLHGSARMVQVPFWGYFAIGPLVLFVLDKVVSMSRKKVLIPVQHATLLPSGVVNLIIKKPLNFNYLSGQWVQIACPDLAQGEYHPFTLTSAPHEDNLSLHIRAVGPWTNNLRRLFSPNNYNRSVYCKLFLDGPFGEGHQDWYKYPVAVLIGGGIGITPFASILKDIAHRSKDMTSRKFPCQKVYFLWVTRTQRSFEWMTDIIREVEAVETADCVNIQICITQMKDKFDLRTAMLYMCERHFQKIAGVSMFTGLRAKTHFGRPKFGPFFLALQNEHKNLDQIGVFSCGPPVMTRNVQQACSDANCYKGPSFTHYYENF